MNVSSPGVFIQELFKDPRYFMAVVMTVVVSICVHELAHGIVAIWHGDRTPIEQGHMTLNPAVHMGAFSAILLLIAGIAWGAMPVDESRLRGRYAPAAVAFAGPLSNFILATLAIAGLGLWQRLDDRATAELPNALQNLTFLLWVFGVTNVALGLFNLIPVPPLDGSRILGNFSPSYAETVRMLTMSGGFIVLFIVVFSGASKLIWPAAIHSSKWLLVLARGHE